MISGRRRKSIGATMMASACVKARASAKCAESPSSAMAVIHWNVTSEGSSGSGRMAMPAITICIQDMWNRMPRIVSVATRRLVAIMEPAKPSAATSASRVPALTGTAPGRTMTRMPTKPMAAATMRVAVSRSRSTIGASTATHSGAVNSSAKSCANGMSISAQNQLNWAMKWMAFRIACIVRRRVAICRRPPGLAATMTVTKISAAMLR